MLLQTLMPYLVIVGVAVLFFLVCCRIVLRKPKKMNRKEHISFSHIKKHATVNEKSVENIRKNTLMNLQKKIYSDVMRYA